MGLSRGLDQKRSGTELTVTNKVDLGIEWHEMMGNFCRSGHPIFRPSSAFEGGELRSKEQGKKSSFHLNNSDENIELLLRTVISATQLNVYGAGAHLCNELSEDLLGHWRKLKHLETMEIPTGLWQKLIPMHSNGET